MTITIRGQVSSETHGEALLSSRGAVEIVAEAFEVHDETDRTPRQIAEERAELVEALKAAHDLMGRLELLIVENVDEYDGGEVEAWCNKVRPLLARMKDKSDADA